MRRRGFSGLFAVFGDVGMESGFESGERLKSGLWYAWEGVVVGVGFGGLICFCGGWVVDGEVCGVLW